MSIHADKILVIGPAWVGDMVMSQSLLASIKADLPDSVIDLAAPRATLSIASRMPEIRTGIPLDSRHGKLDLTLRWRLARSLRDEGYDCAIILPNSFKSGLIPFFAQIPVRIGFRGEFRFGLINDMKILDRQALPSMVSRFQALGGYANCTASRPALSVDQKNLDKLKVALSLSTDRGVVGICPGAEYGKAKQWPERYYAEVCEACIAAGRQVWAFGSSNDKPVVDRIGHMLTQPTGAHFTNLAGKTSLTDAIDLLSETQFVISNDSGLMHIAAAVGRPVIALYGSTSAEFTPPLTDKAEIITLGLECSPCFARTCPLGHTNCLNELRPNLVMDRIQKIQQQYC